MAQSGMSAVLWTGAPVVASATTGLGGRSLIEAHVHSLRRAHVRDIAIVQPVAEGALSDRLSDVQLVLMPHGWFTPFDALVMGLFAVDRRPVLIMPADHDVISPETLMQLMREAVTPQVTHALIPTFHGERGYPVILFPEGVDALVREAAKPQGRHQLSELLDQWTSGVRNLAVSDQRVTQEYAART